MIGHEHPIELVVLTDLEAILALSVYLLGGVTILWFAGKLLKYLIKRLFRGLASLQDAVGQEIINEGIYRHGPKG